MKILSHRGYWKTAAEKNTAGAFRHSFDLRFGTETDVRDLAGRLVISHDMPDERAIALDDFLDMVPDGGLPLAMNIKADGLAEALSRQFAGRSLDWFVFDMSVPDMRAHFKAGNPVFTRMSEVEREPAWLEQSQGVWLDGFDGEWYDMQLIAALANRGKRVCVVSPELHGRNPAALWDAMRALAKQERVMLCTDLPEEATSTILGANK